jgi:hypothetical protein
MALERLRKHMAKANSSCLVQGQALGSQPNLGPPGLAFDKTKPSATRCTPSLAGAEFVCGPAVIAQRFASKLPFASDS